MTTCWAGLLRIGASGCLWSPMPLAKKGSPRRQPRRKSFSVCGLNRRVKSIGKATWFRSLATLPGKRLSLPRRASLARSRSRASSISCLKPASVPWPAEVMKTGRSCGPRRHRASSSISRTSSTPHGSVCPSASPRSARVFATKSPRETSRSGRGSSSRWRLSFSASPQTQLPGIATGGIAAGSGISTWASRQADSSSASTMPTNSPTIPVAQPTSNTHFHFWLKASLENWRASPTAATSTFAATWKANSSAKTGN